MAQTLQLKRETCAWWAANSPVLAAGEPGYESDTHNLKIGDGIRPWLFLDYATTVQPFDWVLPGGTTPVAIGNAVTVQGTLSNPAVAAGADAKARRKRFVQTSAATAGQFASWRAANPQMWRGNVAGYGGWWWAWIGGLNTLAAGNRFFVGAENSGAAPSNVDPLTSNATAKIGFGCASNTGNLSTICSAAAATPTTADLGSDFPVDNTTLYRLGTLAAPNAAEIYWFAENLTTGVRASGVHASNLPAANVGLQARCWFTNNATAAAVAMSCAEHRLLRMDTAY